MPGGFCGLEYLQAGHLARPGFNLLQSFNQCQCLGGTAPSQTKTLQHVVYVRSRLLKRHYKLLASDPQ